MKHVLIGAALTIAAKAKLKKEVIDKVAPVFDCRSGYELVDDKCVKALSIDPRPYCEDGFYQNGQCIDYTFQDPDVVCPPEFVYDDVMEKCAFAQIIEPSVACATGVLRNGMCVDDKVHSVTYECPTGAAMRDGQCVIQQKETPTAVCPDGYVKNGRKCQKTIVTALKTACPDSYEFIDGKCQLEKIEDKTMRCQEGYELTADGTCMSELKLEGAHICATGEMMRNGGCSIESDSRDPNASCRTGFEYEESTNECVKTQREPARILCPKGYVYENEKCVKYEIQQSIFVCPPGSTTDEKNKCTMQISAPLIDTCPPNYSFEDDHCKMTHVTDPIAICLNNGVKKGRQCVQDFETEVEEECPTGYDKVGSECVKEHTVLSAPRCPSGDYEVKDGLCVPTTEVEPVATCPKFYKLEQNTCLHLDYAPPSSICKEGELYKDACRITVTNSPKLECGAGFFVLDGRCVKSTTKDPVVKCPVAYHLIDGMCVLLDSPNMKGNALESALARKQAHLAMVQAQARTRNDSGRTHPRAGQLVKALAKDGVTIDDNDRVRLSGNHSHRRSNTVSSDGNSGSRRGDGVIVQDLSPLRQGGTIKKLVIK